MSQPLQWYDKNADKLALDQRLLNCVSAPRERATAINTSRRSQLRSTKGPLCGTESEHAGRLKMQKPGFWPGDLQV